MLQLRTTIGDLRTWTNVSREPPKTWLDNLTNLAVRGPCPMLNTLSNHGFLPHDGGKDGGLTVDKVIHGLSFREQ